MEGLIKAGTLALQLLPRNALKGMYMYVFFPYIGTVELLIQTTFVQNKRSDTGLIENFFLQNHSILDSPYLKEP